MTFSRKIALGTRAKASLQALAVLFLHLLRIIMNQ